ncbi:MAG TPA: L-histidine N(alpha)-methyltransferase [Acidimicrobiales bacterium]|jgi:L-histidine N-alpha-methyltransferase|nr:L-histidine N(alpha)-methyltransferase [Acidimicrobiales bacterium]
MRTALLDGGVSVDVQLGADELRLAMRRDALVGLSARPKWMPPVWFYDDRGSALYEQITRLPEYYPFRTERALLRSAAGEIAGAARSEVLVELGSGTSEKTHVLLDAMAGGPAGLSGYVAFDVSEATLRSAAATVSDEFGIGVHAIVGDFHSHLDAIPDVGRPRLVAFLGSTIGNLDPEQRATFLGGVGRLLLPDDRFLLATDLVKPVERLVAAYDDAAGVTGEFNRNLLHVLNRELGATFDPSRFAHVARWNAEQSWIEMRLRARGAMGVVVRALGMRVDFASGEEMRTEISAKFTPDRVRSELAAAGLAVVDTWTDPADDYLLTLARPQA